MPQNYNKFFLRISDDIKNDLISLYWERSLSLREIAKLLGSNVVRIGRWFKKCNIPRRNRKVAAKMAFKKPSFREKMRTVRIGKPTWKKGLSEEEDSRIFLNNQKIRETTQSAGYRQKRRILRLKQTFPIKDTTIERMVQEELEKKGIRFKRHYPIIGQPDIAFPEVNLTVFLDGCYWHGCPIHFPSRSQIRDKDFSIDMELIHRGWRVVRYWEHDIKSDVSKIVEDLLGNIKQHEVNVYA